MPDIPSVSVPDRATWRAWLEKNHQREDKVWILMHKRHTGKPAINHRESMEEAICFGWIDTVVRKIDDDIYARQFVKRKPSANWSKNTLQYAEELMKEGRMAPAGIEAYKRGKEKLPFDHHIPKDPEMPASLKAALAKGKATGSWDALAPSYRRTYLRWLLHAKLAETKEKRIAQIVERVKAGKRLGQ